MNKMYFMNRIMDLEDEIKKLKLERVSDSPDSLVGQKPLPLMMEKINLILELQRENEMLRDRLFKAKALFDEFGVAAGLDLPNAKVNLEKQEKNHG